MDIELSPQEDQMRIAKDRQARQKLLEDEAKIREMREHREIQKIVKQGNPEKGRSITFDFEGKPLAVASVKLDKLPPPQWPIR